MLRKEAGKRLEAEAANYWRISSALQEAQRRGDTFSVWEQIDELDLALQRGESPPVRLRSLNRLLGLAVQPATVLGQATASHALDEFGIPRSMRGAATTREPGQVCRLRIAHDTVDQATRAQEEADMPKKITALNASEVRFIEHFSEHGSREEAEKAAGMVPGSGYDMLARPEIQRKIVERETAVLACDALPLAVSTLLGIMQNTKAPASARVQAAKIVLDRAMPTDAPGHEKELHEMAPAEIAERIARLEGLAIARSRGAGDASPDAPERTIFQ